MKKNEWEYFNYLMERNKLFTRIQKFLKVPPDKVESKVFEIIACVKEFEAKLGKKVE